MATRILPTFVGLYHFRYQVDLDNDGTRYTLEFHFNVRDVLAGNNGAWWIDLFDARGQALVVGRKLALGADLWGRYRYRENMPAGRLDVVDVTGAHVEPGADDLGTRVLVQYVTEDV